MGNIVQFETQPGAVASSSIAYEYDINKDSFTWKGKLKEAFALNDATQINSREKYMQLIHEDDRASYGQSLNRVLSESESLNINYRIELQGGRTMIASDVATLVSEGKNKTLIGVISLHEAKEGESAQNYYNSANFVRRLEKIIAATQNSKSSGCLMKLAVNNLPNFISWHGMDSVEKIMAEIQNNLINLSGRNNYIERISINEFGIIIEDTSPELVQQLATKVQYNIKHYRSPILKEHMRLNISMGSVFFPEQAVNAIEAMSRVYIALACVQESKKNFYIDYLNAEDEQQFSKEQIKVMYYMRESDAQDKFCLAYQPIVESRTGKVASYECLLRVKDEDGKVSTAWPIIHVAEKTGFIDVVDNFVLDKVVQDLKENRDLHLTFNVSNITSDSPKWLASCTKYFSDPEIATRATVEITETAAERDMKQTAYFVASLQALGCKVALDDFGAGYTSFRQLKSLSVDMVKIDGMFILDLAENSENLLFIKTLMDFNSCYGLQTIAECVESGEVAKLLMDLNVDYMQGYYFGVPNIDPPWKEKN